MSFALAPVLWGVAGTGHRGCFGDLCPTPEETAEGLLDGLSWHLSPSRAVTDIHCMELTLCLFSFSQEVKGYTRGEITELLNF